VIAKHPKKLVTPFGILVGTGFGASVGIVTQSVAVSVAVGAGLGLLLGLIYQQRAIEDD
jgi:hypothetical protein